MCMCVGVCVGVWVWVFFCVGGLVGGGGVCCFQGSFERLCKNRVEQSSAYVLNAYCVPALQWASPSQPTSYP